MHVLEPQGDLGLHVLARRRLGEVLGSLDRAEPGLDCHELVAFVDLLDSEHARLGVDWLVLVVFGIGCVGAFGLDLLLATGAEYLVFAA